MKSKWSNLLKGNDKKSLTVYFIFRFLIIVCMIRELFNGNFQNAALLCVIVIFAYFTIFLRKEVESTISSTLKLSFCFYFRSRNIGRN